MYNYNVNILLINNKSDFNWCVKIFQVIVCVKKKMTPELTQIESSVPDPISFIQFLSGPEINVASSRTFEKRKRRKMLDYNSRLNPRYTYIYKWYVHK